jgi:hypothetical protein
MARPTFALAAAATLLAAVPAMAKDGPTQPTLLPVADTVTSLPLTLAWTPSTFTPGSLQNGYEVRVQDRAAGATQVVDVPAPANPGTVTASLPLVDGHSYRLRVRGVETTCAGRSGVCRVVTGDFGKEERTTVVLAPAQPAPSPTPPVDPPPPVVLPPAPVTVSLPTPPRAVVSAPVATATSAPPVPQAATVRARVGPLPRWVAPAPSRRLDPGPPVRLRWRANRRATFYNVQVFAGGRKVLSVWPRAASLVLPRGTLRSGPLRIVVWSASGSRFAPAFAGKPWVVQVLRIGAALPMQA